jgi:gliding motility-associated-like protein
MCKKFFLSIGVCLFLMILAEQVHSQSIDPAGTASFCPGGNVRLSVKNAPNGSSFQWTKDGEVIPGAIGVFYDVTEGGSYSVSISGGVGLSAVVVTLSPVPSVPTFSFTPDGQCSATPVQFSVTSPVSGYSYSWDFGDGVTGTGSSTSHVFDAIGNGPRNYNVKVTAKNSANCTATSAAQVVTVKERPDASIADYTTRLPTPPFTNCSGASFNLVVDNISSTIGTNTLYQINWGDGSPSFSNASLPKTGTTHNYSKLGYSTLTLTISGQNGCVSTNSYSIYNGSNPEVPFINPGSSIGLCVPFTFSVPSTSTNNPPGTKYIISKNDGTADEVLSSLPLNYTHTFTETSCGATGGRTPNTFYVNFRADNPCGFSDLTVQPITTSKKPIAKISVAPDSNVCVNSVLTFTNASIAGTTVNNSGVCDNTTFNNWTISPSTGWNRVSGALGEPDPNYNPSSWGSTNLGISFINAGLYKVSLIVRNFCGNDTITKTICVRNPPTASFTIDKKSGCSPLTVSTNNTSSVGPCGGDAYTWKVKYLDPLNCGAGDGFQFEVGSAANTTSPKLVFNKPGRYAIELSVKANAGCGPVLAYDTVDVTSPPTVEIKSIGSVCAGNSFSPVASVNTCYSSGPITYLWNFPNGTPATSISLNPGSISISSGTSSNITLTVTNQCGAVSDNELVNITTKPVIQSVSNKTICSGKSVDIPLSAVPSVTTFSWTSTTSTGSNIGNTSKSNQAVSAINDVLINSGNAEIVVTYKIAVAGGCPSDTLTVEVIVTPNGSTANAGPDQYLCNLSTTTLAGNTATVGIGTWTQTSGPTSAIITDAANPATTVTNLLPNNNYTFVWTIKGNNNSCAISSDEITVFVRPQLTQPNAGLDGNLCISTGNTYQLQANAVQSPEVGKWTFVKPPSTGLASFQNANIASTLATGLDVGVKYFVWTISNDAGCTPISDTVVINVGAGAESAKAGPDQTLCNVTQTTLAGNTPSVGTGTWKQTAGIAANITSPSSPNSTITDLQIGIYEFEWSLSAGGTSTCGNATDVVTIIIRPPLTQPNAGIDVDICSINSNEVTLQANSVQPPEIGKWTVGSNSTGNAFITNASNPNTKITGLNVGSKYLIWTITNDANCSALSDTVLINVGAGAEAANAGVDQELCNATLANLSGNTTSSGARKWRQISGPSTGDISSDISPKTTVTGLVNGTYQFEWSLSAGGASSCGNSVDTVKIIIYPSIQASIMPLVQTICNGGTVTISSNPPTGGNGIYKYQWQSGINSSTFTDIVGGVNPILNASPTADIQYRLAVSSGPCSTTTEVSMVTVQPGISNNTIANSQAICIGNTPAIIVGSVPLGGDGVFSYQWQSSSDNVSWNDLGASSKDYQPPAITSSLTYRRIVKTTLCESASNSVTVTVNPDAQALFQPLKTIDCAPFNITPNVVNQTTFDDRNGSFNWYANRTAIGSGIFPGYTISNAGDSVLIKLVAVSKFGCKNDSMQTWFFSPVNPEPAFALSDTVGCGPLAVTITNTTPNASNYNFIWDFGNGQTSNLSQPGTINFLANPNFGDTVYTVRLKATGGCDTLAVVQSIRVKSLPKSLFTPDIVEGCSPMKVNFTNTSRGSNATFVWDFGDGSARVPATSQSIQRIFNTGVKDTFYVKLYGTNDCGNDTMQYAIVVNPNRIRLDFAMNGNQKNVCAPDTILFVNNTTGANQFVWDFGDGSPKLTTTKGIDSVYHEYEMRGVYTVTLFGTNGCSDTTTTEIITVENRPNVSFTALPQEVCLGTFIQMTNTSDSSLTWSWDFGDGSTSSQLNPAKTYAATGSYQITLTGTKTYPQGFGCAATATANVLVNGPNGELRYKAGFACLGNAIQLETISNNTNQYRYYLGNGDSVISNNPVVNYTYKVPGTYLPSVMLVTGNCSKLVKGIDSVKIDRVQAGFRFSPVYSCGVTRINFTDTSDAYFGIVKREWDFGDGTTASNANPFKNYTSAGEYNIRLRIASTSGCTALFDTLIQVQVRDIPVAAISSDNVACTNNRILFTAATQSIDAIAGHNWNFGNNTTAVGNIVSATYNNTGSYTVRLVSRTSFGCADTITKIMTVRQSPTVTASSDVRICLGQSTQINVGGAVSYQWSPAEGLSCTSCANPVASPTITTKYIVTGTNAIGCPTTDSVTVEVVQPFNMTVTANDTLCIGQSSQLFASGANRYVWNPSVGLNATNIPNPVATPNSTTTYRIVGFDSYNCFTDTAYTVVAVGNYPTVELGKGDTVVAGTAINFNPILTNGPFKNFYWTPTTGLSPNNAQSPVATINTAITYTLVAENIYGCTGTDTISYNVFCSKDDQVYIPNAFSPDGDGVNDVFMVYGKGIKIDYFKVYNRWGQVVFDGGSNYLPNLPQYGWNGKVGGKPATQDVYVYMVQLKCTAGGTFTYKGNVSLLLMR